jgi:YesN/AraC family two-component response regulator
MSIRVLLADEYKIVCQGLRSLFEKEADMEVVAEAKTGWGCCGWHKKCHPA